MNLLYFILSSMMMSICNNQLWAHSSVQQTKTLYQWKAMEFNFPNHIARMQAEAQGKLIPTNGVLIDVQPHYNSKNRLRTFVTLRLRPGVPYTLATISDKNGVNGSLLEPYPNYEAHTNVRGSICDALITSAFRVAITECNQMWVIDSGLTNSEVHCPPQLLLFNLSTDQLIHRFRFNTNVYTPAASVFITPIVDVRDPPPRGSCKNTMIYIADVNYHGLVVYDFMNGNAWRIENLYMYPDPNYGLHTLGDKNFVLMDGIFGMATDKKFLYFHPLASASEYAVPLAIIDNSTLFEHDSENMQEAVSPLGERSSACAASAMDSNSNLYCVTFNPIELIVWNVNKPYTSKNFKKLPINPEELQFVSGMKVVRNHQGNEELWMSSNSYQKTATGTRNYSEINFRIVVLLLAPVDPTSPIQDLHNKLVFHS